MDTRPPSGGLVCFRSELFLLSASLRDTLWIVIVSFRHKGLRLFYETGSTRGVQAAHAQKLRLILAILEKAKDSSEFMLPTFRAHLLKGDRKGFWAIWVNGNWRVTFRFVGSDIELLDYEDYR